MSSTSRRSGMGIDQAMSSTESLGMVGWRAAHVLCTSARPETPSARGGGKDWPMSKKQSVIQAEMVSDAHGDDGGWNWSGSQTGDEPSRMDLDTLTLTPISELHLHKEPYEIPTPNPEQHPTFEGGRSLNGTGLVCCKCTMRYVFSALAWVRNTYDPRRGMVTTLCDWRNSDVDAVLQLQKEKDEAMNEIHAEQLKKRWTGQNADLYREDVFCKQAAGNHDDRIQLMCLRCLRDSENEPLKYCCESKPERPATTFRHMIAKLQNSHKHTVRYLDMVKKSGKYHVRVDPSILRLMTSEFGGSADFVT
eukprot:4277865-Amphidinium_carterae.2